jgi:two-component system sensor kinase FixL
MRLNFSRHLATPAFIALYVLLDWVSYVHPLFGLNITPWNPDPALGLVFWLRNGRKAAFPWFLALLAGELLVRGAPAGLALAVATSLWLAFGYGAIGEMLRRAFKNGAIFDTRRRLLTWLAIVIAGTLLNAIGYIAILSFADALPAAARAMALIRFGLGDMIGIVVSMPLIWMLGSETSRARLFAALWRWETLAYLTLVFVVLWGVFGPFYNSEFRHFYFLFLPLLWAAARQGLSGAALVVFLLQVVIMGLVRWGNAAAIDVYQLQMLDAVMALVGLFLGIVVDELRKVSSELEQTLRLAAAGEMAAAIAHELNQPMTALSVYGKACEYLLDKGDNGPALRDAIHRMVGEAGRAAEVVRRLRDFFRTGALQLEPLAAGELVQNVCRQFEATFREQGVELTVMPLPLTPVMADRLQIELVLRNLVANAVDAVLDQPAGSRKVTVRAEHVDGARMRLSVEDSGNGVSGKVAARLFEPFVSTKASGLGLGLVLSRAIVDAHGGSLWAEVAGHGIFRFVLPLADPGEQDEKR